MNASSLHHFSTISGSMLDDKKLKSLVSVTVDDVESNKATSVVSPSGKVVTITGDVDEAMQFALDGEKVELDAETDRKLLRKIDFYLLPLICILYATQFMDKLSNSYAAVLGLRTDLKMVGDMYSWTGSAFYIGYLAFEFPAAMSLQKFPVVTTVSIYILIWGVILCLHAVPEYAGFVALRTILGAFESSITPAFVIITSQWYKKEEVFLRTAIWFSFNGVGNMLGSGAISYNLYKNQASYSIEAWKIIFIVTGCITILLSIAIFFHIPNRPTEAWFLTAHERKLVVERIRGNQQGFGNKHFKKAQFIEALTDIHTWIFFVIALATDIPNGGITNFGSILLNESLGYSTLKTLLMGMIGGSVQLVGCISFAYCYRFYPSRLLWATLVSFLSVVFLCMLAFASNTKVQFAGYSMYSLSPLLFICVLSSIALNVAGHTKKVTVNAIFLIGYCVGNLIGPQTFISTQAPDYAGAKAAMVGCAAVAAVCMVILWISYVRENRKRDRVAGEQAMEFEKIENHEFADLTDRQNPLFRYTI